MPVDLPLSRLGLIALTLLFIGSLTWIVSGLLGLDPSFREAARLFELFPVWQLSLWGAMVVAAAVFGLLIRHARASVTSRLFASGGLCHARVGLDLPLDHFHGGRCSQIRCRPVRVPD